MKGMRALVLGKKLIARMRMELADLLTSDREPTTADFGGFRRCPAGGIRTAN